MNTTHRSAGLPFWGRRIRESAVLAWAPAKVNLFLEVLNKRSDGFHDIATAMLAIDLLDLMEITTLDEEAVGLECSDPTLPTGPENLVLKAAMALHERGRPPMGAFIRLTKRIPSEAGLGGGSSDAATTLLALNELWGLRLRREELAEVAAVVGSDVAFFLSPPAGWCEGRGERVTPETVGGPLDLVIVKPPVGCPTASVYKNVTVPAVPVDGTAIRKALRRGDAEMIGPLLFNRLQEPAVRLAPEIAEVSRFLAERKPAGVLMTGSGSAVFALCSSRREALRLADDVRMLQPAGVEPDAVYVVKSWPNGDNSEFGIRNSD